MKYSKLFFSFFLLIGVSCSDSFLDFAPKGIVTSQQLAGSATIADQLVISAYAQLANTTWSAAYSTDWVWGSLRSDDSYKGGNGPGDNQAMSNLETFNLLDPNIGTFVAAWSGMYAQMSRANNALKALNLLTDAEMPTRTVRIAEMRFLRAHFHFRLKRLFKYIPYIDETIPQEEMVNVSNRLYTNDELWNKIALDFQFAFDNLPTTQAQKGRANKYAAAAYLAKVRLYQAYEQDENNNVININATKLQEVVTLTDFVINSGVYSLNDNFGKNFTFGYENTPESIFAIQFSVDDGTTNGKIATEYGLNYNMEPKFGCCWFHVPSANMINSFRTGADGLPLFDTFDDVEMKNPSDFETNTFDPRLDHTAAIPTHPFKYDQNYVAQNSWARASAVYGNFGAMKELQLPTCSCLRKVGAFFGTSVNVDILRYDDVLLMKAEALIELNQENVALPLINQIRQRAGNAASTSWVTWSSGPKAGQGFSNYLIQPYASFPNKDYARKALQFERRMEFAMESPRFYDLVRWGIASETMNAHFAKDKTRHGFLNNAFFKDGRDEYLPIPQNEINLSLGLYQQNNGW